MLRLGIVGTENSHADAFVRHLNVEQNRDDAHVVALAGGETEKNRKLAADGKIGKVVETVHEFMDDIDAAVVCNRHGGLHRENAVPLLEAGKHVFVDKPTATTVADVEAMIDAAERGGGVLASWSILRLAPAVTDLRSTVAGMPEPQIVTVTGPADRDDPHAGLFFYGPHVVEPALEIVGNPEPSDDVVVQVVDDAVVALVQANGIQLVLNLVRKNGTGQIPWHATVAGRDRFVSQEIPLTAQSHHDSLDRFLNAALTGLPPVPYEELIPPVRLLAAITDNLKVR